MNVYPTFLFVSRIFSVSSLFAGKVSHDRASDEIRLNVGQISTAGRYANIGKVSKSLHIHPIFIHSLSRFCKYCPIDHPFIRGKFNMTLLS